MPKVHAAPELGFGIESGPVRAINTVYQNTTGRPMLVIITGYNAAGADMTLELNVGTADPPAGAVAAARCKAAAGAGQGWLLSAVVLPNYYYKLVRAAGTEFIEYWREAY